MKFFRKKTETGPRIIGIFEYVDDLLGAIGSVRKKGIGIDTVYSPMRIDEIGEALGARPSPVRFFALVGAITGIAIGFGLSIYTVVQWRFLVSGKPIVPLVPFIIVGFEFCILFGVLFTLLGLFLLTRLPRFRIPSYYDPRFSQDRFGLVVECPEDQKEDIANMLKLAGAESVHDGTA